MYFQGLWLFVSGSVVSWEGKAIDRATVPTPKESSNLRRERSPSPLAPLGDVEDGEDPLAGPN